MASMRDSSGGTLVSTTSGSDLAGVASSVSSKMFVARRMCAKCQTCVIKSWRIRGYWPGSGLNGVSL